MGLLRWMRGGDDNSAAGNALGAGMAEIDALFRPSKHKQTEHIQESRRRRVDVANGADSDVDLNSGLAVIRRRDRGAAGADVLDDRAIDEASVPLGAPDRQHAPITRRGIASSPAAITTIAATTEPND
ncbi:MAG TPA: hypothetical protein VE132_02670 [Micromonosporaceae bacterium]|nr:hypothetical protein [Micromonosporaceae bacterium]